MTSLYDPVRHESLTGDAWNEGSARHEILRITAELETARLATGEWPTHSLDDASRKPKWALYAGAAGAVVALRLLHRYGYTTRDPSSTLGSIHAAYLASPDYGHESGLQLGEIGILTPAVLADPTDRILSEKLVACMRATVGHRAQEITSGATGMMHTALTLFLQTQNEIWKDLYLEGARSLWRAWVKFPDKGQWLWASHIFGGERCYYGACHGIAGNVHALLRGADLLPSDWLEPAMQRTVQTLSSAGLSDGAMLNWPLYIEHDVAGPRNLVQWCHGAAGVVTALACARRFDSPAARSLTAIVDQAAELVWLAGPLKKGPGLCHGTAGNGYAFLEQYRYTGEPHWLDRARRFAAHAIQQSRQMREQYGQGRYSLWTGDAGLAIFLHHCLVPETTVFPGLEAF